MKVSILLPNKHKKHVESHLKEIKNNGDEIIIFNSNTHQITTILNRMIDRVTGEYIILVDPQCKNLDLKKIKETIPFVYYDEKVGAIGFKKSDFIKVNKNVINHRSYQKAIINNINENLILSKSMKKYPHKLTSIIIPFMYNGDRFNLFEACIYNLHKFIKYDDTIELVIHETGTERHLDEEWIKKYNIKYEYTKWDDVFHRGWSLNYAAKNIAKGDMFVFMDADLIIDKQWLKSIKKCNTVAIGWSEMINLNQKGTNKFLNQKIINIVEKPDIERVRKPNIYAAAGGINIYPKEIFYEIKGWCEDYFGTYGGEDNSTFLKLQKFGYQTTYIQSKVFHLYHSHNTHKDPKRFKIFDKHKKYNKYQWEMVVKSIDKWGELHHNYDVTEKKLNVLWCKIDTTTRVANHYDDLLNALSKKINVKVLTQSLQGLHPAIYQQNCLDHSIFREKIVGDELKNNKYDFIICANIFAFNNERWDNINIPKAVMLEDQHGEHNKKQVQDMIDDEWIVLHRYQLNKFHVDLSKYTKCIWFPHSVNTKVFKDYRQVKKYDILQTGALYQVYELRNFMVKYFQGDPRYTNIPRPKENEVKQWPIGKDYAKELNKAYLNVCCGSIYHYPVMKYFEIPACGSVIFGDWFKELGDLGFEPYKNMLVIDRQNIKYQVKLLLDNKKMLLEIAQNGLNLIKERHTVEKRADDLIKIIEENIYE